MDFNLYKSINDLSPHTLLEIKTFFEDYKKNEKKSVIVEGYESAEIAKNIISKCAKNYINNFEK